MFERPHSLPQGVCGEIAHSLFGVPRALSSHLLGFHAASRTAGEGLILDLLLLSLLAVTVPYKACRLFGVFPSFRVLLFVPSLSA